MCCTTAEPTRASAPHRGERTTAEKHRERERERERNPPWERQLLNSQKKEESPTPLCCGPPPHQRYQTRAAHRPSSSTILTYSRTSPLLRRPSKVPGPPLTPHRTLPAPYPHASTGGDPGVVSPHITGPHPPPSPLSTLIRRLAHAHTGSVVLAHAHAPASPQTQFSWHTHTHSKSTHISGIVRLSTHNPTTPRENTHTHPSHTPSAKTPRIGPGSYKRATPSRCRRNPQSQSTMSGDSPRTEFLPLSSSNKRSTTYVPPRCLHAPAALLTICRWRPVPRPARFTRHRAPSTVRSRSASSLLAYLPAPFPGFSPSTLQNRRCRQHGYL